MNHLINNSDSILLRWKFQPDDGFEIDLQLFAAEDEGRTEEPSERKRREEREKGNVAKSSELPSALIIVTGMVTIYILGNYLFTKSALLFRKYFENINSHTTFENEGFKILLKSAVEDMAVLLFPILAITFIAAIVGNVVQIGFLFAPAAISFKPEKLIPNFKKVLPNTQTFFNLFKALAKVIVIGWISYIIISMDFLELLLLGEMGIKGALHVLATSALKIILAVGVLLLAISVLDFYYQKYEFDESLKITKSEAKQEMKESEGDKTLLNRRRNMIRDFVRRGMLKKIPTADVVVVNPTHFSVALSYNPRLNEAPVVVAKGVDEIALIIRRIAKKHGIKIVEDKVIARLLYEESELDMPIPVKFYRAISLIIARLDKFRKAAA